MVRSAAICCKIGLPVVALALIAGHLPALADDGPSGKVEIPPASVEPKAVQVIVLPAADEAAFATKRPVIPNDVPIIMVEPAGQDATSKLFSEAPAPQADSPEVENFPAPEQPIRVEIQKDTAAKEDRLALKPPVPTQIRQEEAKKQDTLPAPTQRVPATANETAKEDRSAIEQPISTDVQEPKPVEQSPPDQEQPPKVALLPPESDADAALSPPPPAPKKAEISETPILRPSLPEPSPFRQRPFQNEIVENRPTDVTALLLESSEPEPPKQSAAVRFLSRLWPGNKEESPPAGQSEEGGERLPQTALAPEVVEQDEAEPEGEKPPIKRFLDNIQFWKK